MYTTYQSEMTPTVTSVRPFYSSRMIAAATILASIPAGLVLYAINLRRMERNEASLGAAVTAVTAAALIILLPLPLALIQCANVLVGLLLRKQMTADLEAYGSEDTPVETAPWYEGVGITAAVTVLLLVGIILRMQA